MIHHTPDDYDLIVGYLGASRDIPDEEREKIESWILDHSDEHRLSESIARIWASGEDMSGKVNMAGLIRLLQSIETPASRNGRYYSPAGIIWRVAAVAAVLTALVFGTVNMLDSRLSEPDMMLVTATGSVGEFTLPDGSHVWLNGGTTLVYNRDFSAGGFRKVKIDGEAYFDVAHDNDYPFIVDMDDMQIQVTGTEFDVRNYTACRTHDIILREGSINVSGPWGDKHVTMAPGEMLVFNRETGKVMLSHTDADNYCRWFERFSIFDNEPLSDILINVSRRYGVDLKIESGVDTSFCLSVTMGGESLESIMGVLSYLSPIAYEIRGNTLYVSAE